MSIEGVDALGHPEPVALKAAGKSFVGQYLKALSRPRVDAYHAAGVNVVLIAEVDGRGSLGGAARGAAQARDAMVKAAALGAPTSCAIYLAEVDFDATPAQLPTIVAYYRAAETVLGPRLGGYGGYRTIKALFDAKVITYGFQTYGWSHGKWDRRAQLQQYLNGQHLAGATVDLGRATSANYGAWLAVSKPTPHPKPTPTPAPMEDNEMVRYVLPHGTPGVKDGQQVLVIAGKQMYLNNATGLGSVPLNVTDASTVANYAAAFGPIAGTPHV